MEKLLIIFLKGNSFLPTQSLSDMRSPIAFGKAPLWSSQLEEVGITAFTAPWKCKNPLLVMEGLRVFKHSQLHEFISTLWVTWLNSTGMSLPLLARHSLLKC